MNDLRQPPLVLLETTETGVNLGLSLALPSPVDF